MDVNNKVKRVLVGIVSYNSVEDLKSCLPSLISEKYHVQIYVVDNNSNESTIAYLQSLGEDIKLERSETNLGFGLANNHIFDHALANEYDYVYLLNQDCYVLNSSIDSLVSFAESRPGNYIYSPVHLSPDEQTMDKGFSNYMNNEIVERSEDSVKLNFVNAAAWLIPLRLVDSIGGFNPLFFMYGEDRDYANRLLFKNGHFLVDPNSKIVHNREFRDMNDLSRKNSSNFSSRVKHDLLRYLTDIRMPYSKAYMAMLKSLAGYIKKSLFRLKFRRVFSLLGLMISLSLDRSTLLNNRAIQKNNRAFLNS